MRSLQHMLGALRAAGRRLRARVVHGDPARLRPEALVIRLDDGDLHASAPTDGRGGVAAPGSGLSVDSWHALLVEAVAWLGPVEVTVVAPRSAGTPLAAELLRFAHRLDCDTVLRTDGPGVDLDKARELWDRGMRRACVRVGGVSADTHRAVVGGELDDAVAAVGALVAARDERGARGEVEVVLPWVGPAGAELRAVVGWARQAGADGFSVEAPFRSRDVAADPEALDLLETLAPGFDRTPAARVAELHAMAASADGGPGMPRDRAPARRRRWRCPVGGQRVELHARGTMCCCPFQAPITTALASVDPADAWAAAGPHLAAIASCPRACVHSDLAPRPLLALG